MKQKHKIAHMKAAFAYAECSTAKRLQVGCVLVKDNRVISIGYNGMPSGWTNVCEDIIGVNDVGTPVTQTKAEVLHAESNAIAKTTSKDDKGLWTTSVIVPIILPIINEELECAKLC